MKRFMADFETATWRENETWVWGWAMCEIGNEENMKLGNKIETFIDYCKENKNSYVYFHNLKFDGEFIIYYLLKEGFTHIKDRKDAKDKTFTTLISDMGQFYNITVYFKIGNKNPLKITFIDSLKIIPFSVSVIAKTFGLTESKLKIDYMKPRKKGHILTQEEKAYIQNDVIIVSKALNVLFNEDLKKMTEGSNALADFKKIIGKKFSHYFPVLDLELDENLRKAYKGGYTYLSPEFKNQELKNIVVLDVNSLYPSCMYDRKLPYGDPVFYKGKYKDDKIYELYIQNISCSFDLKPNKIPILQIKNNMSFVPNEYLINSKNDMGEYEIVELSLTNIDLKLFLEHYDVYDLKYNYGWKFKSISTLFKDYIDKWIERKIKASKEGNSGERQMAKLMLNSLYR